MTFLKFQYRSGRSTRFSKVVSMAAFLLVGVLTYLAANPEAHRHFHHDVGHEDHECVISAFAAGEGFQLLLSIVVEPRLATDWERAVDLVRLVPERTVYALLPICGPPSAV